MLDLKIKGRKAIVCAASKGLGRACAMSLGRAGVDLVITARTRETLEATAEEIRRETGAKVTPIMLIKAVIDGMCERRFGRIVNITSGSVKSPIPNLGMSNGARAGLTAFCAGLARQVAKYNVTINGLLPGPFLTDRLRSGIEYEARRQNVSFEELLAKRGAANPAGRVGDPAEFGDACAFLCAASSGFIVGQNLLLDGGAFN